MNDWSRPHSQSGRSSRFCYIYLIFVKLPSYIIYKIGTNLFSFSAVFSVFVDKIFPKVVNEVFMLFYSLFFSLFH